MQRKKNAKKVFFAGIAVLSAILFVFVACRGPSDPSPPVLPDITWTLEQVGGENFHATSTGIRITFDSMVEYLTRDHVDITGAASIGSGEFVSSPDGMEWVIPINVTAPDTATVRITKRGIEAGPQNVGVFLLGQWTLASWTATPNGTAGVQSTTGLIISFDHLDSFVNNQLVLSDFTVTNGTGSAEALRLDGSGNHWVLTIDTLSQGTINVAINHASVSADSQLVTVHFRPSILAPDMPQIGRIEAGLHFVPTIDLFDQAAIDAAIGDDTLVRANISFIWTGHGADTHNIYWATEAIRPSTPGATGIIDQVFFINNLDPETDYFFWVEAINEHGRSFSDVATRTTAGMTQAGPGDLGRPGRFTYFGLERGDYIRQIRVEPDEGQLTVMWDLRDRVGWYEIYIVELGQVSHFDYWTRITVPSAPNNAGASVTQWGNHGYMSTTMLGIHSEPGFQVNWNTFRLGMNNGRNADSRPTIGAMQLGTPDAHPLYTDPLRFSYNKTFMKLGEGWVEGLNNLPVHAGQGINVGQQEGLGWLAPYTVLDRRIRWQDGIEGGTPIARPVGPDPVTGEIGIGAPGSAPRPHFSTSITITGLTDGTTYQVWVRSPNAHGERGYVYINATPGPRALPVVNNVQVTTPASTTRNLEISWDEVPGATHYRIYLSQFNRLPRPQDTFLRVTGIPVDNSDPARRSHLATQLLPSTHYYVFVVAEANNIGGAIGAVATGRTGVAPAFGIMRPKWNLDAEGNRTNHEVRTLVYVEVNDENILNAGAYILEDGTYLFNYVVIFAANLRIRDCAAETAMGARHGCMKSGPHVHFNENVRYILANRSRYVQPLQDRGIRVLLGLLPDWDGISFGTMVDWMRPDVPVDTVIAQFIEDVRREVEFYGLDGVDFDDEWANKAVQVPGQNAFDPISVAVFPDFTAAWPFSYRMFRDPTFARPGVECPIARQIGPGNFTYNLGTGTAASPGTAAVNQMWREGGYVFLRVLEAARAAMPRPLVITLYEFGHARHITSNAGVNHTNPLATVERLSAAIDFSMQPWYDRIILDSPNHLPRRQYSPVAFDLSGNAYAAQQGRPNPHWTTGAHSGAHSVVTVSQQFRDASNDGNPYGFMFFYGLNPSSVGLATTAGGPRYRTKEEYLSIITQIVFGMDTLLTSEGGDYRRTW